MRKSSRIMVIIRGRLGEFRIAGMIDVLLHAPVAKTQGMVGWNGSEAVCCEL